jgi:hypothetical protein
MIMPISPKDFMAPPLDYNAGVAAGQEVGAGLAEIGKIPDYMYQARLRKPLVDENGQPLTDPQKLAQELLRRGDVQAATQFFPYLWKSQLLSQPGLFGEPSATAPTSPSPPPARQPAAFPATGPSGITGQFTTPEPSTDVSGSTGGAPAPTGPQGSQTAMPASGVQPFAPGRETVPQNIQADLLRADGLSRQAARIAIVDPAAAKPIEDQARQLRESAYKAIEQFRGASLPTEMQRNLQSGALPRSEELKGEIETSQKVYNAARASAQGYLQDSKPLLDIGNAVLNDPSFSSGIGANAQLMWDRVAARFGSPRAAQLKEMFEKTTSASLLAQSNQLRFDLQESAGPGSARIF